MTPLPLVTINWFSLVAEIMSRMLIKPAAATVSAALQQQQQRHQQQYVIRRWKSFLQNSNNNNATRRAAKSTTTTSTAAAAAAATRKSGDFIQPLDVRRLVSLARKKRQWKRDIIKISYPISYI